MKVLVIGSGGREHTIVWKLKQSPQVSDVFCWGGNAGIAEIANCVGNPSDSVTQIVNWAEGEKVDLTIVGPEAYLAAGVVDEFQRRGMKVVGPTKAAAEIESSKVFSKQIMVDAGVPTADFYVAHSPEEARDAVGRMGFPVVIKADGLAAGKGVIIAHTSDEANKAIDMIMSERVFGDAGTRIVVEQFLTGVEASVLAFVDGENIVLMPAAKDHKAIGDGDQGPNTGGMGAFAPAPLVTDDLMEQVKTRIMAPVVSKMAQQGRPYTGILYAGLMLTDDGPYVIEFNARFGDPETQVILPLLKSDLIDPLMATIDGSLGDVQLDWHDRAAVCVITSSPGYPGEYSDGMEMTGLDEGAQCPGIHLFHSGTRLDNGRIVTGGGRVLGVTAVAENIAIARKQAYFAIEHIDYEGMYFRKDIGENVS